MKYTRISNKLKFTVGTVLVLVSLSANATKRPAGPAEAWTNQQIESLTSSVSSTINTFGSSLLNTLKVNFERLMSALNVANEQEVVSSQNFKDSTRNTMTAFANSLRAQNQASAITQAYVDYSPMTGQGYDPCGTALRSKEMSKAYDSIHGKAANTLAAISALKGTSVADVGSWEAAQVANHRSKFCTKTEADSGLCSLSEVPGGDTNAALFFESVDSGSLKKEARLAYINNLVGAPLKNVNSNPSNEQAKQYLFEQNRYISLLSIPAYSLATIDAENTRDPSTKVSPSEQLNNRINGYFGGQEALKWASSMSTQSPRGLLVEAAKIEGLAAWQNFKMVEQNNRILANIAALGITGAESTKANAEGKVTQAIGAASQNAVSGAIR